MRSNTAKWRLGAVVLSGYAALSLGLRGCVETPSLAARGQVLFETGDGVRAGCITCHCKDAVGGCTEINAPNIQGKSYETIDGRIRGAVYHPGGKFDFTDDEVADLAAYLISLVSED